MSISERIAYCVVTGGYSGLSPKMPGTIGTLAAAGLLALIHSVAPQLSSFSPLVLLLFSLLLGTPMLQRLLNTSYLSNSKDPQEVVIDEFAGYYLTLLAVPLTYSTIVLGFFLFRLFDITKPPPIKQAEKLPGALGVMADDLVAALPAAAILYLLQSSI